MLFTPTPVGLVFFGNSKVPHADGVLVNSEGTGYAVRFTSPTRPPRCAACGDRQGLRTLDSKQWLAVHWCSDDEYPDQLVYIITALVHVDSKLLDVLRPYLNNELDSGIISAADSPW